MTNNKIKENGITKKANEISAVTDKCCKTFDNEEIKEILFQLVTTFDPTSGEFIISGTTTSIEESILNRVSFVRTLDKFIESVRNGNSYAILNAMSKITSKTYAEDLSACVRCIEKISPNSFLKEMPLNEVVFEDEILNIFWRSISVSMKKAACLLLVAVGHLTDKYFVIECHNYNGDSCNFYGCLDANKHSFFQGRIPGTEND